MGAKVPGNENSRERKFHGAKVLGTFTPEERKFHGCESSMELEFLDFLLPESESSTERKWVSLKPDRKTADKTAKIISDGRASCMTARPNTTSSAHQTVTLLATVAWARVSGQ